VRADEWRNYDFRMADYWVRLRVEEQIDPYSWEFKYGAYPQKITGGWLGELTVGAESKGEAMTNAVSVIEAEYPDTAGKVKAEDAWKPPTSEKYVKGN
jgi:hypothetical protein